MQPPLLPPNYYQPPNPQPPVNNFVSAPVPRAEFRFTETSVVKPGYVPQQYVPPPPPVPYSDYSSQPFVPVRSNFDYQSGVRGNINLQQIDEQLQMSRKLFPS